MKKIIWIFAGVLFTQTACDLQPKIQSLPDSVGDFISARYPALLADPNVNPEIYNSAATDYGVYASPDLYGTPVADDYVMYASVDDYIIPPQIQLSEYGTPPADVDAGAEIVEKQDAKVVADDYLHVPDRLTDKDAATDDVLEIQKPTSGVQTVTRVELDTVRVVPGDTLYSLSRKYSVPVNDLAVMNNLRAPFNLVVGQKIRVPNLTDVQVAKVEKQEPKKMPVSETKKSQKSSVEPQVKEHETVKPQDVVVAKKDAPKKISSDPTKKLPKITTRSSSKFSWPVRGKILSNYGAKSNGLFNDGINISASRGSAVKAAENGVVAYAGNEVKGMGNLVIIQHSGGWMTVYAHMDAMNVRRGVRVNVGQKIGTIGETGKVDSPQLHFEIRKGTKAYNPTVYLKK